MLQKTPVNPNRSQSHFQPQLGVRKRAHRAWRCQQRRVSGPGADHSQSGLEDPHWRKSLISFHTVDGCEILHQLIGGKHPIIYRVSNILSVVSRISQASTVVYQGGVPIKVVDPPSDVDWFITPMEKYRYIMVYLP